MANTIATEDKPCQYKVYTHSAQRCEDYNEIFCIAQRPCISACDLFSALNIVIIWPVFNAQKQGCVMHKKKPVNLNLMTIRFPITAIVSILHRISGVILFLVIPGLLAILSLSLRSQYDFNNLVITLQAPSVKFVTFLILAALVYHLIAGIRHLIMDLGFGEEKQSGKIGARIVLVISVVIIAVIGAWLWQM